MQDLFITRIQVFVNNNLYLEDKTRFEAKPGKAQASPLTGQMAKFREIVAFGPDGGILTKSKAYSYPSSVR